MDLEYFLKPVMTYFVGNWFLLYLTTSANIHPLSHPIQSHMSLIQLSWGKRQGTLWAGQPFTCTAKL